MPSKSSASFKFVIKILFWCSFVKCCVLLQAVHFITFYAPLWGAILYNGYTYFQVIRMLNNVTRVCAHLHHFIITRWYCHHIYNNKHDTFGNIRWLWACQIGHISSIQEQTWRYALLPASCFGKNRKHVTDKRRHAFSVVFIARMQSRVKNHFFNILTTYLLERTF